MYKSLIKATIFPSTLILCKRYIYLSLLLSERNNTQTPSFKQHDKVHGLYIPPKPLG